MTPEIAFAATAGMLAAFNPCGFALLPGYLALFLGSQPSAPGTVRRALLVGMAVTLGFVAVFGLVGAALALFSVSLGAWLSIVTVVAGLVLLLVGLMLLGGRDVSLPLPRARLVVDGSATGMLAYGVVYATVSLSCTLPVFLVAVVSVFARSGATALTGTLAALAYALGMGLVMVALAIIVGFLGRRSLTRARAWTRHVGRVSGLVVSVSALYVLWYGWVELQTYDGDRVAPGPVTWAATVSGRLNQALTEVGVMPILLTLAGVVVVAIAGERLAHPRQKS